jgi:putative membrane protein
MKRRSFYDPLAEQEIHVNPAVEVALLILLGVLFAAYVAVLVYRITVPKLPFQAMVYTFASLSLVHAIYLLGWRRALAVFALTVGLSFGFEYVGVRTGLIFGRYVYTHVLGPEILGTVPLVIPLAYFMVIYPSAMVANLLTRGRPTGKHRTLAGILAAALLTAGVTTAWDLALDPVMVHDVRAWIWEEAGPYFGIPFHNFYGWVATTFTIALTWRLVERQIPMKPLGRAYRLFLLLPLAAYGGLGFGDLLIADPTGIRVIVPFAMGLPLFAAVLRLFGPE